MTKTPDGVLMRILADDQTDYIRYTSFENKAGYTATLITSGCPGAVTEKVTGAFGQER